MTRIIPIEIDPVELVTVDGKSRKFLLTSGGINRIKAKFGIKTMKELLGLEDSALTTILYEALLEKNDLTEDQFSDLLPYNPQALYSAFAALLGVSVADPKKAVEAPTQVATAIQ